MIEIWKPIKNYEGIYDASNFGRIRSCSGKTTVTKNHGIRTWNSRILKPKGQTIKTGYRVSLWKDGKSKDFLVARLVAFTFFDEDIENRKLTVNHKNGDRFDNHIENLELISLAENIRHGFETGLYSTQQGITLVNKKTNETFCFKSMSKASLFLGKNVGHISYLLKKGKTENDNYYILCSQN